MTENRVAISQAQPVTPFDLPDESRFRRQMEAINRFQNVVHATMVQGHDYGVIPGTGKPTLLKPGAEKIAKLLGLADTYAIMDRAEDWQKPFFRYIIKCTLSSGNIIVSEGIGECNSMESKYRWRWVFGSDVPEHVDKSKLHSEKRHSKKTGKDFIMYRLDNDDIYSQVNTILKMAKKRALVDAALSAGRLSDLFTQDIEDTAEMEPPIEATKPTEPPAPPTPAPVVSKKEGEETKPIIDTQWWKDSLKTLKWGYNEVGKWIAENCQIDISGKTLAQVIDHLTKEQAEKFVTEVQDRLQMQKPQ
jgi:hypothetical protein